MRAHTASLPPRRARRGGAREQVSRVLNLATLAFTILFSGFLLLYVDWGALTDKARAARRRRRGGCLQGRRILARR